MKTNIKIALVDDHKIVRESIAQLLSRSGFEIILEAGNGLDFLENISLSNLPEICILDVNMPVMNGYKTMHKIRERYPEMKVLILSAYCNPFGIVRMLNKGANGYLCKTTDINELQKALMDIHHTGSYKNDLVAESVTTTLSTKLPNHIPYITDMELDCLNLICSDMTCEEVAAALNLNMATVEGYKHILYEKLKVKSRYGLISTALTMGLLLDAEVVYYGNKVA